MQKKTGYVSDWTSRRSFLKVSGCCTALVLAGCKDIDTGKKSAVRPTTGDAELAEWAKNRFLTHWNCSQAVLEALGPKYGLDHELAVKVACPFAAGMWKGKTCGSFTGAYMAIGMAHGAIGKKEDHFAVNAVIDRVKEFDKAQMARFGTLDCSSLLGSDMSTPEGIKEAAGKGMFTKVCPKTVVAAVNEVLKIT